MAAVMSNSGTSKSQNIDAGSLIQEPAKTAKRLGWVDLSYSVGLKRGERKEILKEVSGELVPGRLTALLGPSGCGKTTLIGTLSGRMRQGGKSKVQIGGAVYLDGAEINPCDYSRNFSLVMQDDSLLPTETPRDAVMFAAQVRCRGVSRARRRALTEEVLASLDLTDSADTIVGGPLVKGISGGQRKRTSIAVDLVSSPTVVFLDEPTTGLDAAVAHLTISVLKALAGQGRSVMCTIHQPSTEVFQLFETAIFLSAGEVVYQGPTQDVRDYLARLDFECDIDYNPSDFVMFLVQTCTPEENLRLAESGRACFEGSGVLRERNAKESIGGRRAMRGRASGEFCCSADHFLLQFWALWARQWRATYRDMSFLISRYVNMLIMGVIFAAVMYQVANPDYGSYDPLSHLGALTQPLIQLSFSAALSAVVQLPSENPIFLREYASGSYGISVYLLNKTIVEVILLALMSMETLLLIYWAFGLHANFGVLFAAVFLNSLHASAVGLAIGAALRNPTAAVSLVSMVLIPEILFGGFFIATANIHVWIRWVQWLCPFKYAFNIMVVSECEGGGFDCTKILQQNFIDPDLVWVYFLALVGFFLFLRLLCGLALWLRGSRIYG